MDKNTIIGFTLIVALLVGYSWYTKPSEEQIKAQQAYADSIRMVQAEQEAIREMEFQQAQANADKAVSQQVADYGVFNAVAVGEEKLYTIQNDSLLVTLSNKGGSIVSVQLKGYSNFNHEPLVLFDQTDAKSQFTLVTNNNRIVESSNLYFQVKDVTDSTLTMVLPADSTGAGLYLHYNLYKDSYMVALSMESVGMDKYLSPQMTSLDWTWNMKIRQQERSKKFEGRYSGLYYKYWDDEVENLSNESDDREDLSNRIHWIACKDQFFSTVFIAEESYFTNTQVESTISKDPNYLKECNIVTSSDLFNDAGVTHFSYYFGPNSYQLLSSLDDNIEKSEHQYHLEDMIPLGWGIFGWVNKFLIIPIFNFLGSFISNYGLVIFLLTLIVKLILLPFTYKSYISTAKMRVLRPEIEKINAKIPEDKPMERQQATMALYRKVGVSPMGGCLPMLLQMPVLFALFVFFPAAIELRQQGFLWAEDLSSYDSIFSWTTYIPFISTYYGNHISLFCLLMAIANIVSTKISMDSQNTGQQQMPMMKWMMYLMPIMFLFFFNDYASGLSYYYFISTVLTLLQTFIFRMSVNDEKLLAKLKANSGKPQKQSGFMARLEKMQKEQMARQREMLKEQQKRR
jgi:YidC/Oxa1 family membrane protein insertase